uniref:non-specific serine/threonine protein kinase n=1 Tax=Plectus sambesii TaxID=2011161 RepID=A0A914VP01_9BILA
MWRSLAALVIIEQPPAVKINDEDLISHEKMPFEPATPLEPLVEVRPPPDDISDLDLSRRPSEQASEVGVKEMTIYERTIHMLANDATFQKEIALGKRIGFYRLGKELGAGNFSKVKMGIHVLTKEKVAVKIMEKTKMDQKSQRLLAREIQCMEDMHHPNIIRLFECVETLAKMHLIMEYAGGGELYTYVNEQGRLQESEAKPLFAQIVAALQHMHAKNIVHRDIKAENVIFSSAGWVKIADFGFSCVAAAELHLTTFCGSPPYAAPELFRDKDYRGPLVDIWATGILLHFMVVGQTPFRGETVAELKQQITDGFFTIPDYVTAPCQELIKGMLNMEPEKRITLYEIKNSVWLEKAKFPQAYLPCSPVPSDEELKTNPVAPKVWAGLQEFGVTSAMLLEAAEKGAKNSIIGTYRIVLYQVQAHDIEKERSRVIDDDKPEVKRNGASLKDFSNLAKLKYRSKMCALL